MLMLFSVNRNASTQLLHLLTAIVEKQMRVSVPTLAGTLRPMLRRSSRDPSSQKSSIRVSWFKAQPRAADADKAPS